MTTNWARNQPKPESNIIVTSPASDIRSIVALITLIIGTLVLATGMLLQFGLPAALMVLGVAMIVVGFALGFKD